MLCFRSTSTRAEAVRYRGAVRGIIITTAPAATGFLLYVIRYGTVRNDKCLSFWDAGAAMTVNSAVTVEVMPEVTLRKYISSGIQQL